MIGFVYSIPMFQYAFFRDDDDTHDLSLFGTVCYYLTNCIALPIAYALVFLTLNILYQLYNNLTSLERMGPKQTKIPCLGPMAGDYTVPNEYDMLWLANFKQVLGSKIWKWMLPISEEMKG